LDDKNLVPNSLDDYNCYLRSKITVDSERGKRIINAVDDAFKVLPPLKEDTTFYRGMSRNCLPKEILEAKEGDIITPDNGFAQVALFLSCRKLSSRSTSQPHSSCYEMSKRFKSFNIAA